MRLSDSSVLHLDPVPGSQGVRVFPLPPCVSGRMYGRDTTRIGDRRVVERPKMLLLIKTSVNFNYCRDFTDPVVSVTTLEINRSFCLWSSEPPLTPNPSTVTRTSSRPPHSTSVVGRPPGTPRPTSPPGAQDEIRCSIEQLNDTLELPQCR